MAGFFFSLFFFLVPYALCFSALMCDGGYVYMRDLWHSLPLPRRLLIGLILLMFTTVVVYWAQQDYYIYYWDYSGYWIKSVNRMKFMLWHSFGETLSTLIKSVNEDTYNLFLPTMIAFPLSAFGYPFPTFVVLNFLLFYAPSAFILALSAVKGIKAPQQEKAGFFTIAFLMALLFPICYYATFRGYIDAGFLLFASSTVYLLADYDFSRVSVPRNVFLALLFVLAWISRRYVIYLIIGFVAVLAIKAGAALTGKASTIRTTAINFLLVGGISLGILLLFFRPFFLHALLTDYGTMYSAYDAPFRIKIAGVISSAGYFTVFLCVLSVAICIICRRNRVNAACWTTMLLLESVLFWKTQAMEKQHVMILFPPMYMLCMLCFDAPEIKEREGKRWKYRVNAAAGVLCCTLLLYNYCYAFIPKLSFLPGILCSSRYTALRRDDIPQLKKMAVFLNGLTEGTEDEIYIVASGPVLNSSIMQNLELPYYDNAVPSAYTTKDVDLRDGFPGSFLTVKYVVATDPVELHLASGQEVVKYLSEEVQNRDSCIGRHYEMIQEFQLDQGVRAKIYSKTSEYTEEDLRSIRDYYSALYPGRSDLFSDRIVLPGENKE